MRTFLFFLFIAAARLNAFDIKLQADSVILMNADTGKVLYEKNSTKPQYPASLTKIATAIYTLNLREEKLGTILKAEHEAVASVSDEQMRRSNYTLPSFWLTHGATHMGIKKGEELSLKDLLYGTMVASAGDASNMIAFYMGGTIPVFMSQVNQYLKEIGCHSTYFKNPHGLHHPDHKTTAYDMAVLTKEALKNDTFREIVRTVRYQRPKTNMQKSVTLFQGNRLLRKGKFYYAPAIGVKTGYTSLAKNNLVAAAKNGGRTLIAVLMHSEDRSTMFLDAIKLFKQAFREKKVCRKVFSAGPARMSIKLPGASKRLATYLREDVVISFYPSEKEQLKCLLQWDRLSLPIKKDQKVGALLLQTGDGRLVHSEPLFAKSDVDYHLYFRLREKFSWKKIMKFFGACLAILFIGGLLYELKKSSSD